MKELIEIQSKLKAPKSQYNKFGGYNYRKAEDILEAVKPLLKEQSCTLIITDQIELIGERYYIKATARLTNENGETVETSAYAREEEVKKGMDASQVSGSTSSYARKYALNGLLCIDDTADADVTNTHDEKEHPEPQQKKATKTPTKQPAQSPAQKATEQDIDMGAILLDISSAMNRDELEKKFRLYQKYDGNKEVTTACRVKAKEFEL